jgi:tagaturonate reductase
MENALKEEIIPFVSDDIAATTAFADSVKERFENPFLNHQLTSIALNSVSKWAARVLPSFRDYYGRYAKLPSYLVVGFSYLMALYTKVEKKGDKYEVDLGSRVIQLLDTQEYLDYFAAKNSISAFMAKQEIWGFDLTTFDGFANVVEENVAKILDGADLL